MDAKASQRQRPRTRAMAGVAIAGVMTASTVGAAVAACAPSRSAPSAAGEGTGAVLRVPHAPGPIVLDGDNDDPGWLRPPGPARTGAFALASGAPARPYSDARLLWGDGYLYVLLYAADDDIRTRDDAFRMRLSRGGVQFAIEVSAGGVVRDEARDARGAIDPTWRSGAHVSREIDGTPDDARDTDEEWSVEMAVPLASIGMRGQPGESAGFAVERCDTSSRGARVCGGWGEREGESGGERGRLVIE
jgi:hypothetical protein